MLFQKTNEPYFQRRNTPCFDQRWYYANVIYVCVSQCVQPARPVNEGRWGQTRQLVSVQTVHLNEQFRFDSSTRLVFWRTTSSRTDGVNLVHKNCAWGIKPSLATWHTHISDSENNTYTRDQLKPLVYGTTSTLCHFRPSVPNLYELSYLKNYSSYLNNSFHCITVLCKDHMIMISNLHDNKHGNEMIKNRQTILCIIIICILFGKHIQKSFVSSTIQSHNPISSRNQMFIVSNTNAFKPSSVAKVKHFNVLKSSLNFLKYQFNPVQ